MRLATGTTTTNAAVAHTAAHTVLWPHRNVAAISFNGNSLGLVICCRNGVAASMSFKVEPKDTQLELLLCEQAQQVVVLIL
jgi:hypothetical protein